MIELGIVHELRIERFTPQGAYLVNENGYEILLPQKYLEDEANEGDFIDVFVMKDSQNRRVAVRDVPKLYLNQFAWLEIVELNPYGAFADWGLDKNLFIPFREQTIEPEIGGFHAIQLKYDEDTDRLFGSMKTRKSMKACTNYSVEQEVDLLLTEKHPLGWAGIVDHQFSGMVFENDCVQTMEAGQTLKAFVLNLREDGKLDLRLTPIGPEKYDQTVEKLWSYFEQNKFLFLTDKSDSEDIKRELGMSKKMFKQAIGKLYKARKIKLFDDKIARVDD